MEKEIYLITGGSGLLGHALCHHFGGAGHTVIAFDMAGPPYPPPNTVCLFCDLTDDESVQKTLYMVRDTYGSKIKAVFHLAAYYSFSGKDSHLYKDLTVEGTRRMIRELRHFNFDVGQFIFSSSMLAYKPDWNKKLDEEAPLIANWPYPKSKIETEKLLKEIHGDIPVVILRIAGVYDDVCQSIPLAHQIQRIYENQLEGHFYSGNVHVRQSFVHLADVVSSFVAVIESADKLPDYSVFNIGEENVMSYDEIQKSIARNLHGTDWVTVQLPKGLAEIGSWAENTIPVKNKPFIKPWMIEHADDNYELDISKARQILGWYPKHSLNETLPLMLEGLKVDPGKWYDLNKLAK